MSEVYHLRELSTVYTLTLAMDHLTTPSHCTRFYILTVMIHSVGDFHLSNAVDGSQIDSPPWVNFMQSVGTASIKEIPIIVAIDSLI